MAYQVAVILDTTSSIESGQGSPVRKKEFKHRQCSQRQLLLLLLGVSHEDCNWKESMEEEELQLECKVMSHLVGWVLLSVYMYRLNAELISHLHPPKIDISDDKCVFPFIYGDELYYSCISIHSDFDWCSLDFRFEGRWRYCTALDPPMCIFPFQFRKKSINECTKEGYSLNRSWCSLTNNYNKDKKWKQCSPNK
ncbi:binder of sperm protein homolog 2-like [Acomys russatus]|uniref:binder of sperm protein homolog 2-like n=1 Tax=Acomys russatus TaxID=60746 RepID=UPI0021E2573B|nr:binder of sperm protein homolog 2-like [Acomys russatus]